VQQLSDSVNLDGKGESCLYEGKVTDLKGNRIEDVRIDVWSDNADGFYDVRQPDIQFKRNNRGVFVTGADGGYRFIVIKLVSYPIPDDGPVGQMSGQLDRHPYRPDTVFGVKTSLIAPLERVTDDPTVWRSPFSFALVRR
jgi:hydroxyquinol 1,2-dioxygenase